MLFGRIASKAYPVATSLRGGYIAQRWVAQDHVVGASIAASVASSSYAKQPGAYKTSHDRWPTTVCFGTSKVSSRDYSAGLPVDEPELPARRIFQSEEPELATAFRKYGRGAPEVEPRASLDSPNKDKDYNLWDPSVMNSGSGWRVYGKAEHHAPNGNLQTMPKLGYGSPGGFESRVAIVNEIHKRAAEKMHSPSIISHLAVLRPECMSADEEWDKIEWEHVCKLCELHGEQHPPKSADVFSREMGQFNFRYERYSEFSTYTFSRRFKAPLLNPFLEKPAIDYVSNGWVSTFPGRIVLAMHVVVDNVPRTHAQLSELFSHNTFAASTILDKRGAVFTDSRIHKDGFERMLISSKPPRLQDDTVFYGEHAQGEGDGGGMGPDQAGRVLQRLLEIESFRVLSLMALPVTKVVIPRINKIMQEQHAIIEALVSASEREITHEEENQLLNRICFLSARAEEMAAYTQPKFSASTAYANIVHDRVNSLRMEILPGLQPLSSFIYHRLDPAQRAVADTSERLQRLCGALERSANLLRTRVEVSVEGQNRELLARMAASAQQQLHFTELAEGFSVGAITYYTIGLNGYLLKALDKAVGLPLPIEMMMGGMVPIVGLAMWSIIHKSKKALLLMHGSKTEETNGDGKPNKH